MVNIKWNQGSTRRGIVRIFACIGILWATYNNNLEQIGCVIAAEKAINGMLGVMIDDETGGANELR